MTDPRVTSAVRDGGVERLDERGLMPLAEARARLEGARAFAKGRGHTRADRHVLDSDILWAALLSLEDAAELVRVASKLEWEFHPRGMDNLDLFLRYGEGIVPWLATRVDARGRLVNAPWCVLPCLLACASDAAFSLAWEASDERGVMRWLERHPAEGLAGCARRAAAGDARARRLLVGALLRGQRREVELAVAALEANPSREELLAATSKGGVGERSEPGVGIDTSVVSSLRAELGLTSDVVATAILAHLDACADGAVHRQLSRWPRLEGDGPLRSHGMRVLAARDREGGWGVLVERLQGDDARGDYPAHVAQHAYGNRVPGGVALTARPIPPRRWPPKSAAFIAALRKDLARHPEAYWPPPPAVLARLHLREDAEVLVDATAFAHASRTPSRSPAYRSLADALAHRDPARFTPGKSNVSPR